MTLDEYQQKASATDAREIAKNPDLSVLLLGLAGETGSLLTLYKKRLRRDGDAVPSSEKERLSEEMGDILWYLAAIARRCEGLLRVPSLSPILRRQDHAGFPARIRLCSTSRCPSQRSSSLASSQQPYGIRPMTRASSG